MEILNKICDQLNMIEEEDQNNPLLKAVGIIENNSFYFIWNVKSFKVVAEVYSLSVEYVQCASLIFSKLHEFDRKT